MGAAVTWGTTGTASKLLASHAGANAFLVGSMRMLVAAPLLVVAAVKIHGSLPRPGRTAFAAGSCMAAYQLCFFSAVPLAGVAPTALLAICTAPVMIALLSTLVLAEQMTARIGIALVAGVAGTGLLVGGVGVGTGHDLPLGALLALGAGLAYATYAVVTKAGLHAAPSVALAAQTFCCAALLLLPVAAAQHPAADTLRSGWPLFLYLGAVPTALAYGLYTTGLHHTSATRAGIAALLEPLTATILGVLVFHETFGVLGVLGALLLLAALASLSLTPTGETHQAGRPILS